MDRIFTPFEDVYESFLSKITEDMYAELTEQETLAMLRELLIAAIPNFEFPRFNIFDYGLWSYERKEEVLPSIAFGMTFDSDNKKQTKTIVTDFVFFSELTKEEINILSELMVVEWLGQQLASIENVRMKYSGSDFKFTSQANHMDKILKLKTSYAASAFKKQRLYKRRSIDPETGRIVSTLGQIMEKRR